MLSASLNKTFLSLSKRFVYIGFDTYTLVFIGFRLHPDGDIPCGRSWHAFKAISDSKILLYGGYTTDQKPMGMYASVLYIDSI